MNPHRRIRRMLTAAAVSMLAAIAVGCWPAAASAAAAPPLLWETPEDRQAGGAAGQFDNLRGVAVNPGTGHLYVADGNNGRVVELTAWGEFVKAWGWGVVASGPNDQPAQNERQRLTVAATAGSYRLLHFNAYRVKNQDQLRQTTVPIGFDWPAADPGTPGTIDSLQEALAALGSLDSPGSVIVSGGPGDAGGAAPYEVEFTGPYADKDVPRLLVTDSTLTGGATTATLEHGGSYEICVPAEGDACQAGQLGGSSPGEMPTLFGGITADSAGNVYVFEDMYDEIRDGTPFMGEGPSFRVQKFDSEGNFLAMWGGDVNKTTGADICTSADVESGDVCGTGVPGTAKGHFTESLSLGEMIEVGPSGSIFVGDVGRIQRFSPAGAFETELKLPGERVQALTVDQAGALYVVYGQPSGVPKPNVRKLIPSGETVTEAMAFTSLNSRAVAVDADGNVYIAHREGNFPGELGKVIAYEADGTPLIVPTEQMAETGGSLEGLAVADVCGNAEPNVYVADASSDFLSAYGPSPQDLEACPPPLVPPTIARQFASAVSTDSAAVRAQINPQFWPDTRYYVEYGTGECSAGGCTQTQPAPPGLLLTGAVVKQTLPTQAVFLTGLQPDTTYRYRFVAESSGGGPVFGPEKSFRTRVEPQPLPDPCPNAGLRGGASASLPDCRAYEMVSPVDKEGGEIIVLTRPGVSRAPLSLNQSSPEGNRLTYSSYKAFGGAVSAPFSSTYLATRTQTGWRSEGISPPRGRNIWEVATSIELQYKLFSEDLCSAWLLNETDLRLTSTAPAGYANLYRRENCGGAAGSYESLINVPPALAPSAPPVDFVPDPQGATPDGSHVIFRVGDKLTEEALPCVGVNCPLQLYEYFDGGNLRAVCVLPGGAVPPKGCSAGTASGGLLNDWRSASVANAISEDGARIFWSETPELEGKPEGRIFARIDGQLTVAVSDEGEALSGLSGEGAQYWTAAADGTAAIFSVGKRNNGEADLYEYRPDSGETEKIAGQVYGVLGASEDASRVYLLSREALDAGATAGQPNLYLYRAGEGGGHTYVATLSKLDAAEELGTAVSPVDPVPKNHLAQVSEDGMQLAFMSSAPLTGYDNTDAASGEPAAEVFLYDANEQELRCVSCNPTGALPAGRKIGGGNIAQWAAAVLPTTQTQHYQAPDALVDDGSRLYFESFEALVAADTNGKKDVYQWEEAGRGGCTEASPSYDEAAGGCVNLISSGSSAEDSSLVSVSASGDDVFIATAASLVTQDPGLVDIYDARALGGFPPPPPPRPFCEGEACQAPPTPPALPAPASPSFRGPENVADPPARRRCPKGKRALRRAGKTRCVARKRGGRAAKRRRGQGR